MDDVDALLNKALEWRRLAQMTEVAEVRAECTANQVTAMQELLSLRAAHHQKKILG